MNAAFRGTHNWTRVHLPAALGYTPDEEHLILEALNLLTRRCLASAGVPAQVPDPSPVGDILAAHSAAEARFSFSNRDVVAMSAYAWMAPAVDTLVGTDTDEGDPNVAKAFARCRDEALGELSVEGQAPLTAAQPLETAQSKFVHEFRDDAGIKAVAAKWSACMETAGYRGVDLFTEQLPDLSEVSGPSIRHALADFDCRTTSGYREAKVAWYEARVAAWIEENPALVQSVLDRRRVEVERAQAILGS